MAFKDLSQGNNNLLTSTALSGDIELRSPAGISLYPDSNNTGNDNTVWLREGAKLVFEGPIGDSREIKITAPEPTGVPEDTVLILPTIDGTFALLSDILDSETALTTYIDNQDAATLLSANSYTDAQDTATLLSANSYTDTAVSTGIGALTTDDVPEGLVNLYYTTLMANTDIDARVTTLFVDALNVTAAGVQADSVALGTDTIGNYVSTIAGTVNEVAVTGSGTETAAITLSLPMDVTITNNLTVGGDLYITGTTISVGAANLSVDDSFIYLNQGDAIGADNTVFAGTGLDDAVFKGYSEAPTTTTYYVRIDTVGATDTFEWSKDNFSTTEATGVIIDGTLQDLEFNITIQFAAITGHTLGDVWSGTAAPLNIDTGIFSNINTGLSGPGYTHVGIFYDASAISWKVFSEYDIEPNGDINTGDPSFTLGKMEADCFIANDVDINGSIINNNHATNKLYVDTAIGTRLASTANAVSASKWQTARTITLGGDATGNVSIDGTTDVTLTVAVVDDSHTHDGRYYTETESDTRFINTAGDTMTGPLVLNADPTIDLHAATKQYVDSSSGGASNGIFYENDQIITENYTILSTKNAMSTGPLSIDSGISITVESGARWVIL